MVPFFRRMNPGVDGREGPRRARLERGAEDGGDTEVTGVMASHQPPVSGRP